MKNDGNFFGSFGVARGRGYRGYIPVIYIYIETREWIALYFYISMTLILGF